MAAKRLRDDPDDRESDESSSDKRMRAVPSLSTVIREACVAKTCEKQLVFVLEPLLRRVVKEEVERGLIQGTRSLQSSLGRSSQLIRQIQAVDVSPTLQLVFSNGVAETIFTGSKIEDKEENPLRVLLVDTGEGSRASSLPSVIRVEIVVIDGDFPGERDDWTSEEFDRKIVKERTGRRPLLTGDVLLTLRDGRSTIGELTFTDNSSWIRSRRFRLGARVVPGSCEGWKIRAAMTDAFMVKDHRGELYKKHFPPALNDEVWRLKKIAKDGAFHKKLQAEQINTVQDFLKLSVVNSDHLRSVLGPGMSERQWESTIGHANSCDMGNKFYVHRRHGHVLLLDPVCRVQGIVIDGRTYTPNSLNGPLRAYVRQLVLEAYGHWEQLEEVDETIGRSVLQPQGLMVPQIAMGPTSSSSMVYHSNGEEPLMPTYQDGGFDVEDIYGVQVEFSGCQTWPRRITY